MSLIPHFDLPFRISGSSFAVVDQDTDADVRNCIIAALLTHIGWRPEVPDFGSAELVFQNQPLDLVAISNAIIRHEPRAVLALNQFPDLLDELIAHLNVGFDTKEGS